MLKSTPRVKPSVDSSASKLALRSLFDQEESNLLRYAFSLIGRRAVAEEIVQDVFLQLHGRWEEVESPKAWLIRSIRNRAFNYLRDNRREQLQVDKPDASPESVQTSKEPTPESLLERMELLAALRNMLDELGETDRQLVQLKYFENLRYREISERTGLSVSNVGYRLHHILKELAKKLRPLGIDASHE